MIFWITLAIVNVLPEPVTPSKVWWATPFSMPSVSLALAFGGSPAGQTYLTTCNALLIVYVYP